LDSPQAEITTARTKLEMSQITVPCVNGFDEDTALLARSSG